MSVMGRFNVQANQLTTRGKNGAMMEKVIPSMKFPISKQMQITLSLMVSFPLVMLRRQLDVPHHKLHLILRYYSPDAPSGYTDLKEEVTLMGKIPSDSGTGKPDRNR